MIRVAVATLFFITSYNEVTKFKGGIIMWKDILRVSIVFGIGLTAAVLTDMAWPDPMEPEALPTRDEPIIIDLPPQS